MASFGSGSEQSATFLSSLLGAGADAQKNLFKATFILQRDPDNKKPQAFTARVKGFVAPGRAVSTAKLPYLNSIIEKIVPSSEITKTIKFAIRLDDDFSIYNLLEDSLPVTTDGAYNFDPTKEWLISVSAFKPEDSLSYSTTQTWVFKKCYLTKFEPFSFDYGTSGALEFNITFVYETYYTEG